MSIRDNVHIEKLRAATDMEALRHDMAAIANAVRAGRSEHDIGDDELRAAFERASPEIEGRYGVNIWDAMVLLIQDSAAAVEPEEETKRSEEWISLYSALCAALSHLGAEDAYGDGDYWIVDDDYGHQSHKVCISRLDFITPELIAAVQLTLKDLPHWEVLLQIDEEVNGSRASSTGLTVHHDRVEHHFGA